MHFPCFSLWLSSLAVIAAVTIVSKTADNVRAATIQSTANAAPADDFAMTPAQFWSMPVGRAPRIPMVGDMDGDGHADLISLSTGDDAMTLARTSPLGKPEPARPVGSNFGSARPKNILIAACGAFVHASPSADILSVSANGSVYLDSDRVAGTTRYVHTDLVVTIPRQYLPETPVRAAVADFDGDGRTDVLLVDISGRLLLLRNSAQAGGRDGVQPRFAVLPVRSAPLGTGALAAGNVGMEGLPAADHRARLFWIDDKGQVQRAVLEFGEHSGNAAGSGSVASDVRLSSSINVLAASPDDHIAVGRFYGDRGADLLVGQRLLRGGDPASVQFIKSLPTTEEARGDIAWAAADIDGNGKDDLVRFRHSGERFSGNDTLVHFSYAPNQEPPGYLSTANDGLLDIWKTGKVKPGGLDLVAMGCRVGRQDLIVEVQRYEDVSQEALHRVTEEAIRYFASLPTTNPDGSHGIALHILYHEPPSRLADRARLLHQFDILYPPPAHRGVTHWMSVEHNLGVAQMLGDNGHADPITGVFVHELGHQIGLDHEGHWGIEFAPLYHSMMGMVYAYTQLDNPNSVAYSTGEFASFVLREPHLSERLPFPIDKVRFLSGKPYYFPIKPGPDSNTTLVDWNWNGILGEEDVAADINYIRGTEIGPRVDLGESETAPVLVTHGSGDTARLILFYGASAGTAQGAAGLSAENRGSLKMRLWLGKDRDTEADRWTSPRTIESASITGDPSAAFFEGRTWVAYPTPAGVMVRDVRLESASTEAAQIGEPALLAGTAGAQPTIVAIAGRLFVLLWRGPGQAIGVVPLAPSSETLVSGRETTLGLTSLVPPGAVAGAPDAPGGAALWLARMEDRRGGGFYGRTEACEIAVGSTGTLRLRHREWIAGRYARYRMTLAWRSEAGLGERGRLYQLTGGETNATKLWADQYITMNIPYPEIRGGWLPRYYDGKLISASAPGACWFQGNLVYALRMHSPKPDRNDKLILSFYGEGILPAPMGDFDDVAHIHDYGLSRSIRAVAGPSAQSDLPTPAPIVEESPTPDSEHNP